MKGELTLKRQVYSDNVDANGKVFETCHEFSIPVIDVFGTCGINQFNRATYIKDSVHPNWEWA